MRNYFYFLMALIIGFGLATSINKTSANIFESDVVELNSDNTVLLRGEVNSESVSKVMINLAKAVVIRGKEDYPIYLVLDSPGGSVLDGEVLINYLMRIPNVNSITIFSASMAEHIAQAVTGKRYVTPSGTYMDHRASGTFRGQFGNGEVESRLAWIKSIIEIISSRTAKRLGISLEDYNHKIINEWWNVGENAVESGHADAVKSLVCTQDLIDSRVTVTERSLLGVEITTYSGCPLFANPISE